MNIFKLVGSIYVDNTAANDSLQKTDKKASGVGKTLGGIAKTAGKMAVGVTTAAATVGTAMIGMASSAAKSLDDVQKGAQQLDISYEEYQKLSYACERSGTSIDSLSKGIKKITKNMADMKTDTFDELGVSVVNADGSMRSTEEVLNDTLKSLADMEDTTKRNALANSIFGASYQDLAPLLNSGSKGLEDMMNRAKELGLVMSDDLVDAGANFDDAMDDMKDSFKALGVSLGAEFMPIVQNVVESITNWMPNIKAVLDTLVPVLNQLFDSIMPPLGELLASILPVIIKLIEQIMPLITDIITTIMPILIDLITTIIPPIMQIIESVLPPLIEVIEAVLPLFKTVIELLMPIIQLFLDLAVPIIDLTIKAIAPLIKIIVELMDEVLAPLKPLITEVAKAFKKVLQPVIEVITPVIKALASVMSGALGGAFDFIGNQVKVISGVFRGLIDFIGGVFTGNWEKAFGGLKDIVKNIFDSIVNIIKAPINFIIGGVNGFIKALNKIKIPDWVPGVGGKGINIPEIPKLAKGGTIAGGGLTIVGEAGAELIDMPQGSRVTPLTQDQKKVFDNSDVIKELEKMLAMLKTMPGDIAKQIGAIPAYVSEKDVFDSVKRKNDAWKEMTGNSALA